jgi:hypothetical protein
VDHVQDKWTQYGIHDDEPAERDKPSAKQAITSHALVLPPGGMG